VGQTHKTPNLQPEIEQDGIQLRFFENLDHQLALAFPGASLFSDALLPPLRFQERRVQKMNRAQVPVSEKESIGEEGSTPSPMHVEQPHAALKAW
jgi:hypothetical protein